MSDLVPLPDVTVYGCRLFVETRDDDIPPDKVARSVADHLIWQEQERKRLEAEADAARIDALLAEVDNAKDHS